MKSITPNGQKRGKTIFSVSISLLKYVVAIAVICWILVLLGVNVSAIFASIGVLALIIGFGAESLIADVVTGVFLLFENEYNVGDIVEVNGFRGTVVQIGIRTTRLKDSGENIKIINNSQMTNILNRSDKLSKSIADIGIAYEENLKDLEEKLPAMMEQIYEHQKEVFESAPVYLGVQELAASAVVLRFAVSVKEEKVFQGNRMLNRELLIAFQEANVKIPYDQVEIHNAKD